MKNKKEFSEILNELLNNEGLSVSKFAVKVNIPRSTINNWLNRKSIPGFEFLHKIADYFDISVDYLTGYTDEFGNKRK